MKIKNFIISISILHLYNMPVFCVIPFHQVLSEKISMLYVTSFHGFLGTFKYFWYLHSVPVSLVPYHILVQRAVLFYSVDWKDESIFNTY